MPTKQTQPSHSSRAAAIVIISSRVQSLMPAIQPGQEGRVVATIEHVLVTSAVSRSRAIASQRW